MQQGGRASCQLGRRVGRQASEQLTRGSKDEERAWRQRHAGRGVDTFDGRFGSHMEPGRHTCQAAQQQESNGAEHSAASQAEGIRTADASHHLEHHSQIGHD